MDWTLREVFAQGWPTRIGSYQKLLADQTVAEIAVNIMKLLVFLIAPLFLASCSKSLPPIQTVQNFDLNRYDGEWHELARLPNRFERDLIAAKATYGVGLEGPVRILNEGLKSNGEPTRITGSAKLVGDGKLEVRFDPFPANLFPGDYWVLWIDEELRASHRRNS